MDLWHDTWSWPKIGSGEAAAEREPFWELTGLVRHRLCQEFIRNGPQEKLLLTVTTEGSEACHRFEEELASLGGRLRRKSLVCLKAVCGHVALETIQIVRVGNTDIRLSHFPTAFFFSIHPPPPPPPRESDEPVILNSTPPPEPTISIGPTGFPDPDALLKLAEAAEQSGLEAPTPAFCQLEFVSLAFGLPLGEPRTWWAHLGEGRSVWDIEVQDLTVKISVMGEVVRTLAVSNGFRQDFTTRL